MGQRRNANDATAKGVKIKSKGEECALNMEQRSKDVTLKDARISPNEEEYAGDTVQVHIATITTNLQLSHRVSVQILIRLLWLILISVLQQLPQARAAYLKRLQSV